MTQQKHEFQIGVLVPTLNRTLSKYNYTNLFNK